MSPQAIQRTFIDNSSSEFSFNSSISHAPNGLRYLIACSLGTLNLNLLTQNFTADSTSP